MRRGPAPFAQSIASCRYEKSIVILILNTVKAEESLHFARGTTLYTACKILLEPVHDLWVKALLSKLAGTWLVG